MISDIISYKLEKKKIAVLWIDYKPLLQVQFISAITAAENIKGKLEN